MDSTRFEDVDEIIDTTTTNWMVSRGVLDAQHRSRPWWSRAPTATGPPPAPMARRFSLKSSRVSLPIVEGGEALRQAGLAAGDGTTTSVAQDALQTTDAAPVTLTGGAHFLSAAYPGDGGFDASRSDAITHTTGVTATVGTGVPAISSTAPSRWPRRSRPGPPPPRSPTSARARWPCGATSSRSEKRFPYRG